jgi:hypothetical protein
LGIQHVSFVTIFIWFLRITALRPTFRSKH